MLHTKFRFIHLSLFLSLFMMIAGFAAASSPHSQAQNTPKPILLESIEALSMMPDYIAANRTANQLIAALPGGPIVSINPQTFEIESTIALTEEISLMALSADDQTLIAASNSTNKVFQIDLNSASITSEFTYQLTGECDLAGDQVYSDLLVPEGLPNSVVISIQTECSREIALFTNGEKRTDTLNDFYSHIEPSAATTSLYSFYEDISSSSRLGSVTISESGLTLESESNQLIYNYKDIIYNNGLIYGVPYDFNQNGDFGNYDLMVYDPIRDESYATFKSDIQLSRIAFDDEGNAYYASIGDNSSESYSVYSYSINGKQKEAELTIEGRVVSGYVHQFVYLGQNRFALLTKASPSAPSQLYIFEIDKLTPKAYLPGVLNSYCIAPVTDDFSRPDSGWPSQATGSTTLGYADRNYRIRQADPNLLTEVSRGDYFAVDSKKVEVTGEVVEGSGHWGLMFRKSADVYLTFEVNPDAGTWRIVVDSFSLPPIIAQERTSSAIRPGANTISYEQSSLFYLYINGEQVYESLDFVGSDLALMATSSSAPYEVRFDDYVFVDSTCPLPDE